MSHVLESQVKILMVVTVVEGIQATHIFAFYCEYFFPYLCTFSKMYFEAKYVAV